MVKKGILKAFDAGTYTATIQLDGSLATYLTGIPVSRAIPAAEMLTGRTVALLLFSPDNPDDVIVAGVV